MCKFGEGKIVVPIVLLMVDPEPQVLFDCYDKDLQTDFYLFNSVY